VGSNPGAEKKSWLGMLIDECGSKYSFYPKHAFKTIVAKIRDRP